MKQTQTLLLIVLLAVSTSSSVNDAPTFAPFNFTAAGSFTATGAAYVEVNYPITNRPPPFASGLAFDTNLSRYSLQVTPTNWQWGFPNGTYFLNPNATNQNCYYEPNYNYSKFLTQYQQATARSVAGKRITYTGLVKDPGTCTTATAVTMVQRTDGRIYQYNTQFYVTLVPGACIPEKLSITFTYETWVPGTPSAQLFQLPPTCLNSPLAYCSAYYPCDVQGGASV